VKGRSTPGAIIMPTNKKMKGKSKKAAVAQAPISIETLVQAAEQAMFTQNPEQAIELYQQATSMAASDPFRLAFLLEQSGHAKLSVADQEGAQNDYQQALDTLSNVVDSQNPFHLEQQAGLHLYIGQLMQGKDALKEYKTGIEILQSVVSLRQQQLSTDDDSNMNDDDDDSPKALLHESKRQLSSAFCNAADLFLTDLCFEDNAEGECESYISLALQVVNDNGEANIDAYQTAASLRLSQKRGIEAVDYVLKVYDKIRVACEEISKLLGLHASLENEASDEQAKELTEIDEVHGLPEFEFRVQTSKLLLECSAILKELTEQDQRAKECALAAINVLGSLLAENDDVVEICQLLGEAFVSLQQLTPALHFYERARDMLSSIQKSMEEAIESEDDDTELLHQLDEVTCQLEQCTHKVEELEDELDSNEPEAMEE
jgi:hypothetical protein